MAKKKSSKRGSYQLPARAREKAASKERKRQKGDMEQQKVGW
jgi:hypothetical protein